MRGIFQEKWFQLSQRPRLSPYPNCFSMEAITSKMKDYYGFCYQAILLIFKDNLMFAHVLEDDYQKVGEKAFLFLKKNPRIFKKLIKKISRLAAPFLRFCQKIFRENLEKKSNKTLLNYYLTYYRRYIKVYGLYFFILSVERFLMDYLKDYLFGKKLPSKKVNEYLNILTISPEAMFAKIERRDLLKLASQIYKKKKWKNIFKNEIGEIKKEFKNYPLLKKLIKKHHQKYFWLPRDYEDPIWTEDDIIRRIKNLLNRDPARKLRQLKKEIVALKKKRKEIEKKLKIDKFHRDLFEAMRDGIYYKELRKKIVSLSLYYTDPLLAEIGSRTNLSLRQVRQFLVQELKPALLGGKNYQEILAERIELGAFLSAKGKTEIWQGKEAEKIFKKIVKIPKGVKEIQGLVASPGKVKGSVKIVINPEDCSKVLKGDIMVTVQAVPTFSSAIMRASALIADGGTGITSHPATLAREAGIPCLINTKIATHILKDGDLIEVDANRGVIKIISK